MRIKTILLPLTSASLVFFGGSQLLAQATITTASDNGSNYSGGWNSGSNGGTGFQAWNIWSSGGAGGFGGNFVGDPAAAGIGGMNPTAFGLYAKQSSGAFANGERRLNNSLAIGQTLSFQWSINWDSGSGGKGFDVYSGSAKILNIGNGGNSDIFCNGANVGFAYGTNAMTWNFTRLDANTIAISANGRNGTDSYSTNVVVADGAIDRVTFYAYNLQPGDQSQPYFNNLTVTEPVASSMAVPGDYAFFGPWAPDGSRNTAMTLSTDPATPNLWFSNWRKLSDARVISLKFVANGTFDFAWGADPNRPGHAKRGGDPIQINVLATGLYRFRFDQATLQYSLDRATPADISYAYLANVYSLGGEGSDDDGDGLTNGMEYNLGTDPSNSDSDADTLPDGSEVNTSQTNPLNADSDGDLLPDWWEVAQGLNPNSSTALDGATGDPDGDGFTNKQEFEGQSNPKAAASVPANRAVTFRLDLNRQITSGSFLTNGAAVEVWGTFNDWGNFTNKYSLTNNGSGNFSGTFVVPGAAGATNRFKFVTFDSNNTLSWEPGGDRVLVMGNSGVATNLPLAYLGEVRPVTFSVNMAVQSQLGNFTVGGTNEIFVVGTDIPGGWDPGTKLTQVGSSAVYSGTVWISGQQGSTSNFKFRAGTALNYEDSTLLGADTRVLTLGARDLAQTNPEVYFNNASGMRLVTFAVNMNVQTNTNKLSFNPSTDFVEVRGTFNSYGGGTIWRLTNNGSGIFTGSFTIPGSEGVTNGFKYVAVMGTNTAYERIDIPRTNSLLNRNFIFGPSGTPQTVHSEAAPALFSQDDGIGPVITLKGQNPMSLNAGDPFTDPGATVEDLLEGLGTDITGAGTVNAGMAGNYTLTYNASDAAGNAALPVTRSVVVTGSSFAGWSEGTTLNPENLAKYAIGGATSFSASSKNPVATVDGTTLSLSAIVRTNDTNLTVVGEAGGSLTNWSTSGVSVTASTNTNDVPDGCQRQVFSVDRTNSSTKQFLRLKATLAP